MPRNYKQDRNWQQLWYDEWNWEIKRGVKADANKKLSTHSKIQRAIKDGRLIKPTKCETCGVQNKRLLGHHDDYNKPLDVRWLCPPCHGQWHANNTPVFS